jgi:acetolactate synthase-1/2/3 large subunit
MIFLQASGGQVWLPMIRDLYVGTGGGFLVATLQRLGVRTIYSVPGTHLLPVWDALADAVASGPAPAWKARRQGRPIRLVVPASEWEGVFAAIRQEFQTDNPGVVMASIGPGCVNELPGLRIASQTRVPLLSISPVQPREKEQRLDRVYQGLRQSEILAPFCKSSFRIETLDQCEDILQTAWRLAQETPAGPVRVEIEFPLLFRWTCRRLRLAPAAPATGESDDWCASDPDEEP